MIWNIEFMIDIKNNNFDFLRLFAACQVMFGHTAYFLKVENTEFYAIAEFFGNFYGVAIFFLISGFLISYSYDRNKDIFIYFKNRFLRIFPALYVNLLMSIFLLNYFYPVKFDYEFLKWLCTQLTCLQFFNIKASEAFGTGEINAPLWTISIELFFYASLPVIFWIFKKSKSIVFILFVISLIFFVYNRLSDHNIFINKLINVSLLPYLFIFLLGFYFYRYFSFLHKYIYNKFYIYLLIFCIFKIFNYYFPSIAMDIMTNCIIFSFLVFSFAYSFSGLNKIFKNNDFTYGTYIYHMYFVNIFVELGYIKEQKYAFMVVLLSLLCGVISWFVVEKPILGLKTNSLYNIRYKNV